MHESAQNSSGILLLVLPTKRQIFAFDPVALTRAQGSKREVLEGYKDALLLDRNGVMRKFEQITFHGPWGETFGRKLLSRLTDAWNVMVNLSQPISFDLNELKNLILKCISADGGVLGPETPDIDSQRVAAIRKAISISEIFDILDLNQENALDVL